MTQKKPNILYILADDLGYGDLSCFNEDSKIDTPHLNQLARTGMKFTDAHSSSALCTPSRYSILTGRYNWRSRLKRGVIGGYSPSILEERHFTVGNLLKQANYQTSFIGKWHLGLDWVCDGPLIEAENFGTTPGIRYDQPIGRSPVMYGFDYFYGISASLDMPPYVYIENDYVVEQPDHVTVGESGMQFWREGPTAPSFKHADVLPHLTNKVLTQIEEKDENPFFIFYSLTGPHTPMLPSESFKGRSKTNLYGDFLMMCDAMVGRIIEKIEQAGLTEDTIIIFASDNGAAPVVNFSELEALGHFPSKEYRGAKADIYEGGHRIPMIVKWPRQIKAGATCHQTISLVDLIATLSDVVQVPLDERVGEDSLSNLSLWLEPEAEQRIHEAIVNHSDDGSLAIRQGNWKLITCPGSGGWSFPTKPEDLVGLPEMQLFNLKKDPAETTNILSEHPSKQRELLALLKKYIEDGRTTEGPVVENVGGNSWEEICWIKGM